MKLWGFGAAAALGCLLLGLGAAVAAEQGWLPNGILQADYRINLSGAASYTGFFAAVLVLAGTAAAGLIRRSLRRARMGEQSREASSRLRFFQRLDHELKNPLTIIRLGTVNLQQSANLTPDQAESVERIDVQTQRLQRLVANLRLLAELEAGGIERKPIPLRELLEESIALSAGAGHQEDRITLEIQRTPWPVSAVLGDRDLLVLAFRNLLDNALKFTQPADTVEVRASEDGRMAIVDVADTGIGIPAEDLNQIFEELYRGRNARGLPGSGLGLRLVQRIIALHEGSIQVRSKPNQGTVFSVHLPLAPEAG